MSHVETQSTISADQVTIPAGSRWARLPMIGGLIGVVGIVASWLLGRSEPEQLAFSWLVAFLYFLSIAIGALFFVLTHFATGARWSVVVRRLAENVMAALPVFALLFVPVWLGRNHLYHWTRDGVMAGDALLSSKSWWLDTNRFGIFAAGYLLIWAALAIWFYRTSRRQDVTGEPALTKKMIAISAPALFAFAISVSLAAIDWIMTLDAQWYSTMFGVYFFAGSLVGFFAVICLLAVGLRDAGIPASVLSTEHLHDLGKLLFAFTVFWAYIAFSQYFLIWYGNIPEETLYYMHRSTGGWMGLTKLLAIGHFAVPFFFLMSRAIKRSPVLLTLGATWMLLMHLLDVYWLVMPTLHVHDTHFSLLDLTCLAGVGGIFLAVVGWLMRRGALVPYRDPRLADSLGFENI